MPARQEGQYQHRLDGMTESSIAILEVVSPIPHQLLVEMATPPTSPPCMYSVVPAVQAVTQRPPPTSPAVLRPAPSLKEQRNCIPASLPLHLQPHPLSLHVVDVLGRTVQLHPHVAARLVHQIDSLQREGRGGEGRRIMDEAREATSVMQRWSVSDRQQDTGDLQT